MFFEIPRLRGKIVRFVTRSSRDMTKNENRETLTPVVIIHGTETKNGYITAGLSICWGYAVTTLITTNSTASVRLHLL